MFEGVLVCPPKDMVAYHSAHAEFQRVVEEGTYAESHTIRQKLRPGQCLVFNNRRMLHGRDVSIVVFWGGWGRGAGGRDGDRGQGRGRGSTCSFVACLQAFRRYTSSRFGCLVEAESGGVGWGGGEGEGEGR